MTSTSEIEAMIAALDTEYQAAVKINDAATMDRILTEDFILVTGHGKVYNKTDLLNASKNKDAIWALYFPFRPSLPTSMRITPPSTVKKAAFPPR